MSETVTYRSPTYYELAAPPELDWRPFRGPEWFAYRRQWDERPLSQDPGPFPLHLDLDPTNRCNLRCSMCPRSFYIREGRREWNPQGRPGDMDFRLYEKLIAEGAANGLKSIKLNFLGEPLLYPRLGEMVRLASGRGLWVMMNTNATLLTEARAAELLEAGLSDIFFSFDSPYEKEYQAVRVGADFRQTLANIKAFMTVKERLGRREVQTRASMVLPEKNADDLERVKTDYIKLFRDMGVAEIGFGLASVMGLDYEKEYGLFPGFVCPDLFRRLFVFWDGPVGPCCGDWERRLIMGDANSQTLAAIWRGPEYTRLRQAHATGHYENVPACRACSVPYLSHQTITSQAEPDL